MADDFKDLRELVEAQARRIDQLERDVRELKRERKREAINARMGRTR